MAQLLVLNKTNGSNTNQYQRGDVVVIMPDNHEWGSKEGLPNYVRCRVNADLNHAVRSDYRELPQQRASPALKKSRLYKRYQQATKQDQRQLGRRQFTVSPSLLDTVAADGFLGINLLDIKDKHHAIES